MRALRADIYVAGADALARWALGRRRRLPIAGESIWSAPLEYVILMKLEYYRQSGSERHLRDIAAILRQSGEIVDDSVLTEWTQRLRLSHEWELARDPGRR